MRGQRQLERARAEGATVFQAVGPADLPARPDGSPGLWVAPTLVTNVNTTSTIVQEEVFGPVLVAMSFRTAKEGIKLANNTRYGLGASVWTEKLNMALEVALSIKAGTVWVNGHNMFDAAAGFVGYRESGFGRDGGKEGLFEYIKPKWQQRVRMELDGAEKGFGATTPGRPVNPSKETPQKYAPTFGTPMSPGVPTIHRTYKLYIGGKQARPDATYVRAIRGADGTVLGQVAEGNRKDIRNAVEAAHKGAPGWGKRAAHNRAQIMYYIAENLESRFDEIAARIAAMTGRSVESATEEVHAAISR